MLIAHESFFVYIGSAHDRVYPLVSGVRKYDMQHANFQAIFDQGARDVFFLNQTHSNSGLLVPAHGAVRESFIQHGDYIVTQKRGCAIGVLTADCLPIVFFDSKTHSIAAIHAGWRGAVAGIAQKALEHMITACGSHPADIWCYMGPSARSCCYEVGPEIVKAFEPWGALSSSAVIERNGKLFCDLISFTSDLLVSCGVKRSSIEVHPSCTIEDHAYFSYRRDGQRAGRQMTLICLR